MDKFTLSPLKANLVGTEKGAEVIITEEAMMPVRTFIKETMDMIRPSENVQIAAYPSEPNDDL